MIIKNARIYTMGEAGIIENGYVRISGNIIGETGDMKDYDTSRENIDNADIIDAGGKWLLPGFIDAHTHLGMYEDGLRSEGDDVNEITDPCAPHLRSVDAINPADRAFSEALSAGIVCVASGPGSANPISGQFAVIKTYNLKNKDNKINRIEDIIIKEPVCVKFALGENPKICYGEKNQTPETRMATAAIIRENLYKAKKYGEKKKAFEEDNNNDEPEYDIKLEALLPVTDKEIAAHIHAHRADDIFTAVRLCREFDIDYVIVHCTDGHLIAGELAGEKAKAIIGPVICDRSKPELKNLELSNAKVLSDAGVLFAITTDHPETPLQYLPYCAALAVKGGLGIYEALKAITINPAIILGIDDILGSIEKGRRADLVLYNGNPLEILTNIDAIILNGEKFTQF